MKSRHFLITDIDEKMIVEETTRKDILGYIDEHLENIEYGNDMSDYAFRILYKDGSTDEVSGNDYDGHKIKRINILSIVVDNPCTSITYGNYRINLGKALRVPKVITFAWNYYYHMRRRFYEYEGPLYKKTQKLSEMKIDNNIIEVTNYE